jgi:hypothetical protein
MTADHDVTILLRKLSEGDSEVPEELMPLVYDELRRLAYGICKMSEPGTRFRRRRSYTRRTFAL